MLRACMLRACMLCVCVVCAWLTGCAATTAGPAASTHAPPSHALAAHVIEERYVSVPQSEDELDSLASWQAPDGRFLLIASAKSSHRLVVFDADTGVRLEQAGGPGAEPGRFRRPNGLAVHGDLLFVAERDNRRVQVLRLPGFVPVDSFGNGELRAPYGLWLRPLDARTLQVYVTDNYMLGERYDVVPPLADLDRRVRRYRVSLPVTTSDGAIAGAGIDVASLGHFGGTTEATALRMVESIAGDPVHGRLLIADERMPRSTLREYTLDGQATGRAVPEGSFDFEAEGVALWPCGPRGGYWVAVDQLSPQTVFHLFERDSLAHAGSFRGLRTARTDGIALRTGPSPAFPAGVLFAVDSDRAVAAFDLRHIVETLSLPASCLPPS